MLPWPVSDLDAVCPGRCCPLDGNLQQAVVRVSFYTVLADAGGQRHAAPEGAVETLVDVEAHVVVEVVLALPRDGQGVVVQRDLYVLAGHARELDPDHEVLTPGEHFRVGDPGAHRSLTPPQGRLCIRTPKAP